MDLATGINNDGYRNGCCGLLHHLWRIKNGGPAERGTGVNPRNLDKLVDTSAIAGLCRSERLSLGLRLLVRGSLGDP